MTLWCLKCCEPFDPVKAIHRGRWTLGVDWVAIDEDCIAVTAAEAKVMFAVARGNGRPVNRSFVAEFSSGEECKYPLNALHVRITHLRAKLGDIMPIEKSSGGLRWKDPLAGSEPGTPHTAPLEGDTR